MLTTCSLLQLRILNGASSNFLSRLNVFHAAHGNAILFLVLLHYTWFRFTLCDITESNKSKLDIVQLFCVIGFLEICLVFGCINTIYALWRTFFRWNVDIRQGLECHFKLPQQVGHLLSGTFECIIGSIGKLWIFEDIQAILKPQIWNYWIELNWIWMLDILSLFEMLNICTALIKSTYSYRTLASCTATSTSV